MQCIYASYYKLLCSGVGTAVTIWQIGIFCMQDVHNILLYCNTNIIKPATGRASICSASLKTTRRLAFRTEKKVCQPVIQFWFTKYAQYTAIYCPTHILICRSNCIELYCTKWYCNTATYWYIVTALEVGTINKLLCLEFNYWTSHTGV